MARITALRLQTALLPAMREFYGVKLGFPIVEETDRSFTLQAGETRLTFDQAEAGDEPFYHFAFNIPENQILVARDWQLERTPLMPIPASLQSKEHPDGIVSFSGWNAHALYFYDPADNVVEYIARHGLDNASEDPFGVDGIRCVSEIAFIVDDVRRDGDRIGEAAGVEPFKDGDDQFQAMGDDDGLLLIMRRGRTLNFNPADPFRASRVFPTEVGVRAEKRAELRFNEYPYCISATP